MSINISPKIINRKVDEATALKLQSDLGCTPALARIYTSRGITSKEALDTSLKNVLPVKSLTNAEKMAELIADKMAAGQKFVLVADYDSDGATSCAIGIRAMRGMGADIEFLVPNRFIHGYGLTPSIVQELIEQSKTTGRKVDCIVTVDNGIASVDGVAEANKNGISVLVTDHHLAGSTLPNAECIVNPNQPGCTFESKNMAGCGVIFYVMMALKRELTKRKWFDTHPNYQVTDLLDFVALGTVADVVKLDDNNRRLVAAGLAQMQEGRAHAGVKALLQVASRSPDSASTFDMGFAVGPRLNAAGRLDDMSIGIECLLSDDPEQADRLAKRLDALNRERREIEAGMTDQALEQISSLDLRPDNNYSMTLFHPEWHQGVIGIVASRIKDRTNRPTISFARGNDGELKGSCRSIPGLHMRDALDLVYKRNPGLIKKFGGHSMAAGLTIMEKDFPLFQVEFETVCRELLPPEALDLIIETDGHLTPQEISLDLAYEIENQHWGQGFPAPLFNAKFKLLKQRQVGQNEEHAKLTLGLGNHKFDAIMFRQTDPLPDEIQAAYAIQANEFNGTVKVSLRIERIETPDAPELKLDKASTEFQNGPDGLSM